MKDTIRRYLIVFFCPETEDWEYDKKVLSSRAVKTVLTKYENEGCLHPYEVLA